MPSRTGASRIPLRDQAIFALLWVALPVLAPLALVRDAVRALTLWSLPRALDAEGRAHLRSRLSVEAPCHVLRVVTLVRGMASGDEEAWRALALRFADGSVRVVASPAYPPALDEVSPILDAVRRVRGAESIDRDVELGISPMLWLLAIPPTLLVALGLSLVDLRAAGAMIALLPLAGALHQIARAGARHVVPLEA